MSMPLLSEYRWDFQKQHNNNNKLKLKKTETKRPIIKYVPFQIKWVRSAWNVFCTRSKGDHGRPYVPRCIKQIWYWPCIVIVIQKLWKGRREKTWLITILTLRVDSPLEVRYHQSHHIWSYWFAGIAFNGISLVSIWQLNWIHLRRMRTKQKHLAIFPPQRWYWRPCWHRLALRILHHECK